MKAARMVKIPIQVNESIDVIKEMKEISEKYGQPIGMKTIKTLILEEHGD